MRREEALSRLRATRPQWERLGVAHLAIFGSVARDGARADSDVDVLVEFSAPAGLFELFRLRRELERLLGTHVDLGRTDTLRPEFRTEVLAEAVRVS